MVSLTSVRQSVEEFGLVAVDIVQDRMRGADGPRRVDRLATTLVERSTTAPAPPLDVERPVQPRREAGSAPSRGRLRPIEWTEPPRGR